MRFAVADEQEGRGDLHQRQRSYQPPAAAQLLERAMLRRAKTTTDGSSCCTAILMKKYGMPQKIEIAINKSQPLRVIVPPLYFVVHTLMLIQHPCQRKVALDVGATGRA